MKSKYTTLYIRHFTIDTTLWHTGRQTLSPKIAHKCCSNCCERDFGKKILNYYVCNFAVDTLTSYQARHENKVNIIANILHTLLCSVDSSRALFSADKSNSTKNMCSLVFCFWLVILGDLINDFFFGNIILLQILTMLCPRRFEWKLPLLGKRGWDKENSWKRQIFVSKSSFQHEIHMETNEILVVSVYYYLRLFL